MKNKGVLIVAGIFVVLAGLIGWSLLLFIILRTGLVYPQAKVADATGFTVKFGVLEVDAAKQPFISKETTTIPLKLRDTGFEYGPMIVPPNNKPFTYQLIFHFPTPPKVISGDGFDSNTPSTTMKTPVVSARGITSPEFAFDEGDPMGDQSIDVYVNGHFLETIKFTVVAADKADDGN
jgi:hypothetical protein